MHNKIEEQYVFYRMASGDIHLAKTLCDLIESQTNQDVKYSMIRDVIIIYCRPFMSCKGKFISPKLNVKGMDFSTKRIHDSLLKWRNTIIAHTDLSVRDPKLHKWTSPKGAFFPIVFKSFYSENMPTVKEIRFVCEVVEKYINLMILKTEKLF